MPQSASPVTAELVREAFVTAIARNDPRMAARAVVAAIDGGMPVRDAYLGVIQPALHEVGRRWERGELSVAQEHLATATAQAVIARLSSRLHGDSADSPVPGRAIVACTPGELHELGARFVVDFLEGDGWDVLALGPSTPGFALLELAESTNPAVIALSTTLATNLDAARGVLRALGALEPRPFLIAGGAAYAGREQTARELGADAYAGDAEAVRDLLRARAG